LLWILVLEWTGFVQKCGTKLEFKVQIVNHDCKTWSVTMVFLAHFCSTRHAASLRLGRHQRRPHRTDKASGCWNPGWCRRWARWEKMRTFDEHLWILWRLDAIRLTWIFQTKPYIPSMAWFLSHSLVSFKSWTTLRGPWAPTAFLQALSLKLGKNLPKMNWHVWLFPGSREIQPRCQLCMG
jgi:hypothetical protein